MPLQKVADVFGIISEGEMVMKVSADELKDSYADDADALEEFYLDVIQKGAKVC